MNHPSILNHRRILIASAALVVVAVLSIHGFAQDRPREPHHDAGPIGAPVYQYVGLDRTIARIDPATGRIWVLIHPEAAASTHLVSLIDKRNMRWQEISVERERPGRSLVNGNQPTGG